MSMNYDLFKSEADKQMLLNRVTFQSNDDVEIPNHLFVINEG